MSIYDDYNSWLAGGSQTQGQWASFDQWMTEQGYRLGGEDNDQWIFDNGQEDASRVNAEELERLQQQYSGWLFANESGDWGSAGMPIGDSGDFFDPNKTQNAVTIDGKQYVQMGTGSMADIEASGYADQVAGILQPMKDPTYGWVVPLENYTQVAKVAGQYNIANEGWTAYIPMIVMSLLGAGVAGAAGAGAALGEGAALSDAAIAEIVAAEGGYSALPSIGMEAAATGTTISPYLENTLASAGTTTTDVVAPTLGSGELTAEQIAAIVEAEGGYSALPSVGMEGTAVPATGSSLLETLAKTPTPPTTDPSSTTTGSTSLKDVATVGSVAGTGATLAGLGGGEGEIAPTGAELLGEAPPTFEMTPEEWAQSLGATLNPDGTINWDSVDQTELLKSLGYIDSGAFDEGVGASTSLSDLLKAINAATGVTTAAQLSDAQQQAQDNESGSRTEENILTGTTPSVPDPTGLFSRLANGTATADDLAKLAGILGSTGLGILGANKQADAYTAAADKYFGLGAPYRDRLNSSYSPGFDLTKADPGFQSALDQTSSSVLRGLSTKGNPYDNPGGLAQANSYILNNAYLPQLNTYRSQLGSFGGLGVNTAGTMDSTKAGTSGGLYDALGSGLRQLTGDSMSLDELAKRYGLNTGQRF